MAGWDSLIASFAARAPQSSRSSGPIDAAYVVEGLTRRGLPQHIAEGFAMNYADESGFDPGINEANPTVAGSRGGYGLYQLTGPRRRAYEAFAADRGVDMSDPYANADAQMDFQMMELQGPERRAFERIMATTTAGEAGAAIVNDFLRPAEEYRERRAAKYLGGASVASSAPTAQPQFNRLWLDMGMGNG